MSLATFLQQYLTGISLGRAYALTAIDYILVYGILHLISFIYGDVFVTTRYSVIFAMASLPWFIVISVTLIVIILPGVIIGRVAYRPLRSTPRMSVMISAIGASYLLQDLATYLPTVPPKGYLEIPFLKKIYRIGRLSASFVTFLAPILTLVLIYLLALLINHTKIGMAMRAVSKDYKTAPLMGVKINKTITFTFAAGPLLADINSIPYFMDCMTVFPFSGVLPGSKCFMTAVFGGIGSIPGAAIGGPTLGLGETALIAMGQSTSNDAFTFILLTVMLFIRPTGLLSERTTDKV